MKMVYAALLICCVSAGAAEFNPICKKLTMSDWNQHLSTCMTQMGRLEAARQLPPNGAKLLCDCLTDEYVNKTTCSQLDKYAKNPELRKNATKQNTDACIQKLKQQGY